jgi:hypothetical protein
VGGAFMIANRLAGRRLPIAARVLAISALSLIILAVALFLGARQSIHDAVRAQILNRVDVAAGTLLYLGRDARSANYLRRRQFAIWLVPRQGQFQPR